MVEAVSCTARGGTVAEPITNPILNSPYDLGAMLTYVIRVAFDLD